MYVCKYVCMYEMRICCTIHRIIVVDALSSVHPVVIVVRLSLNCHRTTYIHTFIHEFIHTYIHTYMTNQSPSTLIKVISNNHIHTYIQTLSTYIQNIHTYIYTCGNKIAGRIEKSSHHLDACEGTNLRKKMNSFNKSNFLKRMKFHTYIHT
jgi:hypothetical protein